MFEQAVTPAFLGFYAFHMERLDAWQQGAGRGAVSHDAEITQQGAEAEAPVPEPAKPGPPATQHPKGRATPPRQLNLFD